MAYAKFAPALLFILIFYSAPLVGLALAMVWLATVAVASANTQPAARRRR